MATIDESAVVSPRQFHHRRFANLQPLSPRVPQSIERHFEQYLIDHHSYPKLPAIPRKANRQNLGNSLNSDQETSSCIDRQSGFDLEHNNGPISRLLNSEHYRQAQSRLIEYRQHSKIPGVSVERTHNSNDASLSRPNDKKEILIPLKEVLLDSTRAKQFNTQDDFDLVSDDSVNSHQTDRRRRAKHWIKDHQFFFTEYQ